MIKQKVLLLTDIIPPYRIPVFNIIAENTMIDFTVLSLTKNIRDREWHIAYENLKFRYQILNNTQIPLPLSNRLPIIISPNLTVALKNINPDIIIITGYYQPAYLKALFYAKKRNIKVICWVESNIRSFRFNDIFSYNYKKWFLKRCDNFIVPGMRSKEFLLSLKIDENKIFIAPNAVDNDYYYVDLNKKYPKKSFQSVRYPRKNFLYVGRLLKEKGIQILLKAYKKANFDSDIGLILIGSGKDEIYFKSLCKKLKLNNIFFEGFKQIEQVKDYYKLADIFVFPSLRDEWGLVLNEAAIAGLPIISTDEPAASDTLVNGKNGWIIKKNDIMELCNSLKNILLSDNELMKKGIESQKKATWHSPQRCASSIIESINRV